MEGKFGAPDSVIIRQDETTELHVQAMVQGGRRLIDVRIWKRGPTGFVPSRTALVLQADDLDALQQGIEELLETSDGGKQVARVVWDSHDGRRLRAETEPFGTRQRARFGFWQRVRDSWKPVDDGLTLPASQMPGITKLLERFRPWLIDEDSDSRSGVEVPPKRGTIQGWPNPGADWLTLEADQVTFHPKGIRLTSSVVGEEGRKRVVVKQWRREENLWLPEDTSFSLSAIDLDQLLSHLWRMTESHEAGQWQFPAEISCSDGSTLRVGFYDTGEKPVVHVERRPAVEAEAESEADFEMKLSLPAEYLPRFGRLFAESWTLLTSQLTAAEREELARAELPPETPTVEASDDVDETLAADFGAENVVRGSHVPFQTAADLVRVVMSQELKAQAGERGVNAPAQEADVDSRFRSESTPDSPPSLPEGIPLGEVQVGDQRVSLLRQEDGKLGLYWAKGNLELPTEHLESALGEMRDLYYEALRGRRGRTLVLEEQPLVSASVRNHEMNLYFVLAQEVNGEVKSLEFPANEVPAFLDAAGSALSVR